MQFNFLTTVITPDGRITLQERSIDLDHADDKPSKWDDPKWINDPRALSTDDELVYRTLKH